MFAQSPFVSQFICSRSKLSFNNCLQQQQSLLVSLRHSSSPTSRSWAARCLLERKINSGKLLFFFPFFTLQWECSLGCVTLGDYSTKLLHQILPWNQRLDAPACTFRCNTIQQQSGEGQGQGQAAASWLMLKPSAILAPLRWNLEQSSSLAEMKIKRPELQQKICARRLTRHQSAKPHLGWTHWCLKKKQKQQEKKRRPFGFSARV